MGWDTLKPFLDPAGLYGSVKGAFVLCKTSNPSSVEIQALRTTGTKHGGLRVFERVAALTVPGQDWNRHHNVGLVVGATDIESINAVRKVNRSAWILAPGVGAQGGDLEACCKASITDDGFGLLLPISRGISAAPDPRKAAFEFRDAINAVRKTMMASAGSKTEATSSPCSLESYQRDFIDLSLEMQVLRFGQFTLKSGRASPYFFQFGLFNTGKAFSRICMAYAARIAGGSLEFDVIFGPAYKGISLAAGVAGALYAQHGIDVGYAYNRKEAKDHGEGGMLVGAELKGKRCLIVDDVISAGTAIREAKGILDAAGAILAGVVVALDREERTGKDDDLSTQSAVQSVCSEFSVPVMSIVGLAELLAYLVEKDASDLRTHADAVRMYKDKYGA
jgi:orotate phosphoribosyltransferase